MKRNDTTKNDRRIIRHARIRAKVSGTAECPRISVFRSLKKISAQFIDDQKGVTLCAVSSSELKDLKDNKTDKTGKVAIAYLTGKLGAEKASALGINRAVFDSSGYRYHGRVSALADGMREGGIKF